MEKAYNTPINFRFLALTTLSYAAEGPKVLSRKSESFLNSLYGMIMNSTISSKA